MYWTSDRSIDRVHESKERERERETREPNFGEREAGSRYFNCYDLGSRMKSFGSLVGARSVKHSLVLLSRGESLSLLERNSPSFSLRAHVGGNDSFGMVERKRWRRGRKGKRMRVVLFYRSTDSDDTRRAGSVRWRGKHDKFDVRHTLQLGATSLHLLVLQRACFELRQSQGRCLGDNREGWRRHHVLAPYSDGATLRLRGVQLQTEQRQYGVHQSSCPKW